MAKKFNPLVSICMPTFNKAEYLAEAVNSALNQTYKKIEVVVFDDGSTDSTHTLLDYFTEKDPKRFHHLFVLAGNIGIAKARNNAVAASNGDFIAVMDSDDIMAPDRIKDAIKAFKKDPTLDFVYTSYLQGDENGKPFNGVMPPSHPTKEDYRNNRAIPHVTVVARRQCFLDNPYRENLKVNDDAGLFLDWFKAGYKGKLLETPSVIVRYHETSTSVTKDKEIQKINKQIQAEYDAL